MTSLEQIKALGPSVIRTVTSWLIAKAIVLATVTLGWAWAEQVLASDGVRVVVETAVAMGWYAGFRWLETQKDARWGWLLGLPGAPVYVKPFVGIEIPADGKTYDVDLTTGTVTEVDGRSKQEPAELDVPRDAPSEHRDDFEQHDGNGAEDYTPGIMRHDP